MIIKIDKWVVLRLLVVALFILISPTSSKFPPQEEPSGTMAGQGSGRSGSSHQGGWNFRWGCGSSPDGSSNYRWEAGSGPGGSTWGFGSGAGQSGNGGGFGFGWGGGSGSYGGGGNGGSFGFESGGGGGAGVGGVNFNGRFGFGGGVGSFWNPAHQPRPDGVRDVNNNHAGNRPGGNR